MRVALLAAALAAGCAACLVDECQRCVNEGRLKFRCAQGWLPIPYCPGSRTPNCVGYAESKPCFENGQVCQGGRCGDPPGGCATPDAGTRLCRMRCAGESTLVVDCATFNEQPCDPPACLGCSWEEPCPEGTVCRDILGCVMPEESRG